MTHVSVNPHQCFCEPPSCIILWRRPVRWCKLPCPPSGGPHGQATVGGASRGKPQGRPSMCSQLASADHTSCTSLRGAWRSTGASHAPHIPSADRSAQPAGECMHCIRLPVPASGVVHSCTCVGVRVCVACVCAHRAQPV